MNIFSEPLIIRLQPNKIITFGKPEDVASSDNLGGVSRFGGEWRRPSYLHAYLRAAEKLINSAKEDDELDEIGLPAFYLLRHTMELLIKRLLEWIYEYAEAISNKEIPSKNMAHRIATSHDVSKLCADLIKSCKALGIDCPPVELQNLCETIKSFEISETWSRYDSSRQKVGENKIRHTDTETILNLTTLAKDMREVVDSLLHDVDKDDAFESRLIQELESVRK